jgi:hypothetical protein
MHNKNKIIDIKLKFIFISFYRLFDINLNKIKTIFKH